MSKKHEKNCKMLPKWSRNRCQNATKINARTGIEKDQGNHQKSYFSEEWNHCKSLEKQLFFMISKVACANGKGIKKTSTMRPNSIRNSMKNRYKKHARKKRAKIWKLIKKVIQKWNQNHSKITPKIDPKKGTEKRGRSRKKPGPAECAKSTKAIISKESFGRKQRRKPTEVSEQGGVQKVECKRHIQKGKCRQGTHTGPKHARWPATTCGFNIKTIMAHL